MQSYNNHSTRRCEKLDGLSPPAFKSGGGNCPPSPTPLNVILLDYFSQTQFLLAALLASMAVHLDTVTQPLGVSVTVDTSWEGLEDFAMVGGQSKQRTKEQKIPVPSILDRNQSSFSSPTILLTHPPAFILPFHFLSLQLPNTNIFSPPFPSLFLFSLLFYSLPPSLRFPFPTIPFSPHPPTQILTSVHRRTLVVSKAVSIKLVPTSVTALLDTREQMQHTVVSYLYMSTLKLPQMDPFLIFLYSDPSL